MTIYYLMVKTHKKTGLRYLCQTRQKNPHEYTGSGIDWSDHLNKFGTFIHTEIILQTHDKEELKRQGRYYSTLWHVVTAVDDFGNKIWANRIPETGGGPGWTSEQAKRTQARLVSEGKHYGMRRPDGTSAASDSVINGTNPWLTRPDGSSVASDKVKNGSHNFLGGELQRKRVEEGTHHLLGANKGIDNPRHSDKTYNFVNDDGRVEMNVTQFYMKEKYKDLSSSKMSNLVKGHRKMHGGWRIV